MGNTKQRTIPPAAYDRLHAFALWQHNSPIEFSDSTLDQLNEIEADMLAEFGLDGLSLLGIAGDGTTLVAECDDETIELIRGAVF